MSFSFYISFTIKFMVECKNKYIKTKNSAYVGFLVKSYLFEWVFLPVIFYITFKVIFFSIPANFWNHFPILVRYFFFLLSILIIIPFCLLNLFPILVRYFFYFISIKIIPSPFTIPLSILVSYFSTLLSIVMPISP